MGKCISKVKEHPSNIREGSVNSARDQNIDTMKGEAVVGGRVTLVKTTVTKGGPSSANRGSPRVTTKVSSNVVTNGSPKVTKKITSNVVTNGSPRVTTKVSSNVVKNGSPRVTTKVSSNVVTNGSPRVTSKFSSNVVTNGSPKLTSRFSSNVVTKGSPKGAVVAKPIVTKGASTGTRGSPTVKSKVISNVATKGSPQEGKRHVVSKTIQLKGNGSDDDLPSFSQRFEINNHGITTSGIRRASTDSARSSTPKARVKNGERRESLIGCRKMSITGMGKTTTTTEKRTYSKDGKVFEDEVVTTVIENDEGTKTTTKTTTKQVGDDADSFDFDKVKKSLPKDKKSRSRSSSSSSDSDDGKKTKSKPPSGGAKGLLGKLKSKTKTKSSSNSDDSSDDEDFAEAAHKEINTVRKKHCVDKLKLSKEMCKYAKEWAVKMAKDDQMSHRPDGKYGQNMFCLSSNQKGFKVEAKKVVDQWYAESKDHKFGKEPEGTSLQTGHFSQIIWKDCKQMGVGKARSASGLKVFIVANFDPKGNWMGQFAKQVPPVGGFPKGSKSSGKARSSSSSSSSSDSSSDEEDFIDDCIKSHNDHRKKHGVQPLKKSKKLNKFAKEWAETIAKKDRMEHRSNNEYGENIYCAWSSNPKHKIKGNEAVESWYEEIKDFTFGKEPADLRAGHFTQVVWEDSKEVGLGMARSKAGKIYVVANYSPAGNYVGSFATKVPKIK